MEQISLARRETPADADQILDDGGRDPRAARDIAVAEPWVFVEHRTLAEVFVSERRR
jgi:hypothetical protein